MQCVYICVCVCFLSGLSSLVKYFQVSSMLLHVLEFCFIMWLNSISYTLAIHFSERWTLTCFYLSADMNNDTINILSIPFKIALITKYQLFPILQPHIIQGHFTDFVTSSHCLNSVLFSELCLFYLFKFFFYYIKGHRNKINGCFVFPKLHGTRICKGSGL